MSGRPGGGKKPGGKKRSKGGKKDGGGWIGCLIVLAVLVLPVALPIGWSMWDEGVFDPDLSDDATAVALSPNEAARLAERLREASQRQGICYGWEVDADTGAPVEVGSGLGAGVDARSDAARCPKWIVLKATYTYMHKEWSSVGYTVVDGFPDVRFDSGDLASFSVADPADLEEGRAVAELADMIGALPLLAAQTGVAPALPAQEQALDPTASTNDELSSTRGAGWWFMTGLGVLLIGLGLLWVIRSAVKERKGRRGL